MYKAALGYIHHAMAPLEDSLALTTIPAKHPNSNI